MQSAPEDPEPDELTADLLVIGAGMAGMTAAAHAAQLGLAVGVIEKAPQPGGSALLSGGFCWAPKNLDVAAQENPYGDPALIKVLVEGYDDGLAWLRSLGVGMSDRFDAIINTFPSHGCIVDILQFMRRAQTVLEESGGWLVTSADVEQLIAEDGVVKGCIVTDRDGRTQVRAEYTLLASGGFQNNGRLRKEYLGPNAEHVVVRSNPHSAGRGMELALSVGAALSPHMDSFYGHLVPTPLAKPLEPPDYVRLAQLYSPRAILLNKKGERFTDESISYHHNGRAVARLPESVALLVGDDDVLALDRSGYGGATEQLDRVEEARTAGGHTARAQSLAELAEEALGWGYAGVEQGVERFNAAAGREAGGADPPRRHARQPMRQPPFFAVEVQPALTFTMGGPLINADTRVLRPGGEPVPGLLAAGADAGGLYHDAYLGGLSMGLTFGRQAAKTAAGGRR